MPLASPLDWASCMRNGNYEAAWRISDLVMQSRRFATPDDPTLPYHKRFVWDGTRPDGRHVLVRCYHGLGDTLQFARFLPALRALARHVTLETQPALCGLFAGLPGVDRLVAFDPAHPLPPAECNIEIMELCHMLRVDVASPPYVTVQADRLAHGRRRAAGHVALCWAASEWDNTRSVPLSRLIETLGRPGQRFISLQRGPTALQAEATWFANPADEDSDVIETAALICGADHVVTVDTMVAHLAGALGCKATVLLKPDPDWRWPAKGSHSDWYPNLSLVEISKEGPLL